MKNFFILALALILISAHSKNANAVAYNYVMSGPTYGDAMQIGPYDLVNNRILPIIITTTGEEQLSVDDNKLWLQNQSATLFDVLNSIQFSSGMTDNYYQKYQVDTLFTDFSATLAPLAFSSNTGTDYEYWRGDFTRGIFATDAAAAAPVQTVAGKTGSVSLVVNDITDATTLGKSIMTAASGGSVRTAIGAGTSSFTGAYADLTGKPTIPTTLDQLSSGTNSVRFTSANAATFAIMTGGVNTQYVRADGTVGNFPTTLDAFASGSSNHAFTAAMDTRLAATSGTNTGDQDLSAYEFTANVDVKLAGKADAFHEHNSNDISDSTGLGRALISTPSQAAARSAIGAGTSNFSGAYGDLSGVPSTFTPSSHNHAAGDVTSGTFADGRISQSSVTQHEAALSIASSQITGTKTSSFISDFGTAARGATQCYSGITQKLGCFPVFKSSTTSSGSVTFHLTTDGTSGGDALFPNGADPNSFNFYANDSTNIYTYSVALSNGNKTATVTVKILNLLALGLSNPANGTTVYLSAWGN